MARRRYKPEEIVSLLRQASVRALRGTSSDQEARSRTTTSIASCLIQHGRPHGHPPRRTKVRGVRACARTSADHDDIVDAGAALYQDGREVGVVNSPAYSHRMNNSLALCHVAPSAAAAGTRLELKGETVKCAATVSRIPFYDPEKTRTHA